MKAWILHKPNDFRYEEVEIPAISDRVVLVKVKACGICGSDVPRIYKTGAHNMPLIPGHEFSGEVVDAPEADNDLIGKRVGVFPLIPCMKCDQCKEGRVELCRSYNYLGSRCNGGFAEYVAVPVTNLIELPDSVSYEVAAMLEPMAVAAHAIRRVNIKAEDRVLVIGLGTIGLLMTMFLVEAGYRNIFVVGKKVVQKDLALKLGVSAGNYYEMGNEPEADVIFECVGSNAAFEVAVAAAAPMGRVVTVGNPAGDMTLKRDVYWKILRNQLTLIGTWNSSFVHDKEDDWHYALDIISKGRVNQEMLITHRLGIEELKSGLELMRDKKEPYVKVMMIR